MIAQGSFREDLYYRLNGITLELPYLAQRSDKERLIRQIIACETRDGRPVAIEIEAFRLLLCYSWPGNIRELRNVIRTALAICEGGLVCMADLPREIRDRMPNAPILTLAAPAAETAKSSDIATSQAPAPGGGDSMPLAVAERGALLQVIEKSHWNMSTAAHQLGISRNTLYRKIKLHNIPLVTYRRNNL